MKISSYEEEIKPELFHLHPHLALLQADLSLIHSFTGQCSAQNFIGLMRYLIGLGKKYEFSFSPKTKHLGTITSIRRSG